MLDIGYGIDGNHPVSRISHPVSSTCHLLSKPNTPTPTVSAMPVLSSIHIYPIKATGGVALDEAAVEPRGLAHDRRWMLVDKTGRFLTQREHARLALVRVHVQSSYIEVRAPAMAMLKVPFPGVGASRLSVRVWKNEVEAAMADKAAQAWFSRFLGFDCRLVYMDAAAVRPVDARYSVGVGQVSFADGYPLLLTSEVSLAALNARLDVPVPMTRFRPNLVVRGVDAFAEDQWQQVHIGEVLFHVVKPCARCVVTTIDQQTAVQGKEPLRTLGAFRRREGQVYFGVNLIPDKPGVVHVGDAATADGRR